MKAIPRFGRTYEVRNGESIKRGEIVGIDGWLFLLKDELGNLFKAPFADFINVLPEKDLEFDLD